MSTSLPRLGAAQLPALQAHLLGGELGEPAIGIVHLGLGNFHRAHQAIYTEQAMLAAGGDWGICGVTVLDEPAMQQVMAEQDNLYSVLTSDRDGQQVQIVRAIRKVLVAPRQQAEVLAQMRDPRVRIVSLTVTEKGYCYDAKTNGLDFNHPAIQHDLAHPDAPRSVPGYLVAALRSRRDNPFTVLSCDNLAHNGRILRKVVVQYAEAIDAELGKWVAESVRFPCTMVDRIVPATTDEIRDTVARITGCVDAWPVPGESFRQWVIEDDFPSGRPAWEKVGAMLVDDVIPYELAKLRMLNGTHSTMAYLGVLGGFETVDEAIADPAMFKLIHAMMSEEIAPTLSVPDSFDRAAYRDQLLMRYANPALKHKTMQIASDGSLKLPPRLLGTIADRIAAGASYRRLALAVAAWMRFLQRRSDAGLSYEINDPMAAKLGELAAQGAGNDAALLDALLGLEEIFPPALATHAGFRTELMLALACLGKEGARATIAHYA
ncbi:mannitol dehydrogenase family protein [Uliginosibacterium sp. 31-16]|uniref:mannitol dehydrogenase family protein n=1 Tax=Uliginosibacterium sp. 31-16 TaxID=3068315 RepID=UPI00273E139D|nr:mannitol dehydrogenase family protein [Uliginosibacterium sp. 31-16]MDP5241039.1 mannitol dehydrogenase family protein [Uliginosibacterium sp. 31-16]